MTETDIDVLITGSGPVGLICAAELLRHGISPNRIKLIDKRPNQAMICKASGIQTRTLEIFDCIDDDIINNLKNRGLIGHKLLLQNYSNNNIEVMLNVVLTGILDSRFDYILMVEQWYTEQCILEHIKNKFNFVPERGVGLKNFVDNGDYVTCDLENTEGKLTTLKSKFVVGCDGVHSFVRNHLKLNFEGITLENKFILGHVQIENIPNKYFPRDAVGVITGEKGMLFITPMPDNLWIVCGDLNHEQLKNYHNGKFETPTIGDIENMINERSVNNIKVTKALWLSNFQVDSRQVTNYSKGRVFLCGDACHAHSPLMGQGMNTGIQDSFNLAWKLKLVIKNKSGQKLLDSYHDERYSIGKMVVQMVEQMQSVSSIRNPYFLFFRSKLTSLLGLFPFIIQSMANQSGETIYTYRNASLAQEIWIRPSVLNLFKRRQQNITRLIRRRIKSGDRVPDFVLTNFNDKNNNNIVKRFYEILRDNGNIPFLLLLFEGDIEHKNIQTDIKNFDTFIQDVDRELHSWIRVIVIPSFDRKTHEFFGVKGQCLYVIRPDGYVGLRSEPISLIAIKHWLSTRMCAIDVRDEGFIDAYKNGDWFLTGLVTTLLMGATYYLFTKFIQKKK